MHFSTDNYVKKFINVNVCKDLKIFGDIFVKNAYSRNFEGQTKFL